MNKFSNVEVLEHTVEGSPSLYDIDSCPSFIRCDADFVRNNCGPYATNILEQVISWNEIPIENLRFSATSQRLGPNAFSSTPGWHHDWYSRTGWESDTDDHSDRPFILVFWIGNTAPTQFYIGEWPDNWDDRWKHESNEQFWMRRHRALNQHLADGNGSILTTQSNTVYKMNHTSIHRATPSDKLGFRILFRVEYSTIPAVNRVLNSVTSYLPIDTYHSDFELVTPMDRPEERLPEV